MDSNDLFFKKKKRKKSIWAVKMYVYMINRKLEKHAMCISRPEPFYFHKAQGDIVVLNNPGCWHKTRTAKTLKKITRDISSSNQQSPVGWSLLNRPHQDLMFHSRPFRGFFIMSGYTRAAQNMADKCVKCFLWYDEEEVKRRVTEILHRSFIRTIWLRF